MQLERDLDDDLHLGEQEGLQTLVTSTIVNRSVLVKILRRLLFLLEEEFTHLAEARAFEEKFLEIIEMLNQERISRNEFFEEDKVVQALLKKIFEKLLRNMNSIKADAFEIEVENPDRVD